MEVITCQPTQAHYNQSCPSTKDVLFKCVTKAWAARRRSLQRHPILSLTSTRPRGREAETQEWRVVKISCNHWGGCCCCSFFVGMWGMSVIHLEGVNFNLNDTTAAVPKSPWARHRGETCESVEERADISMLACTIVTLQDVKCLMWQINANISSNNYFLLL